MSPSLPPVLDPYDDPRFTHQYATLGPDNHTYHYLYCTTPGYTGPFTHTIFLIHGWPDISMGWRYQIPALLEALPTSRIIAPDLLGFGRSSSPPSPPTPLSHYGLRAASTMISTLASTLTPPAPRIILGGHDWGGAVVYRCALYYPSLITHLFSICTPYTPPATGSFMPLHEQVERFLPNFRYQLQLGSGEVERVVRGEERMGGFLRGMYGARGADGEVVFTTGKGVIFENLGKMGKSPLLEEREVGYYVAEYVRNGLEGTLNWYRTTKVNYDDERELTNTNIDIPTLFVLATQDAALPESMSKGMEAKIPRLTRKSVEASHWALWQKPAEVNKLILDFLKDTGAIQSKSVL